MEEFHPDLPWTLSVHKKIVVASFYSGSLGQGRWKIFRTITHGSPRITSLSEQVL